MKNADYWRGRFSILEQSAQGQADQSIQKIEQMYLEAQQSVQKDIEAWYGRFAMNNGISLSDARKLLTTGQLEEFRWTVDQYIKAGNQAGVDPAWLKKLENASAKYHVSRLEAVQVEIQQQLELLYGNQVDEIDSMLKRVVGNNYTHTAFEIQKGLGLGWDVTALSQKRLETLISRPWTTDGRTFRDRCWLNKEDLVNSVNTNLVQGMLRGDSPEVAISAIQKQFGVSRYKARRLVRTETTYFNAQSTKEVYKDLDIEHIEILETLDGRTCPICGGFDGKMIPISEYEPGVTVPPFHPNCRGTTCPYYDDMDGERAARNADGEVYYVPANMTYKDWKAAFVDGRDKDGLTVFDVARAAYSDITGAWYPDSKPNSHTVQDLQTYTVNGTTYTVDGHNVLFDYSPHEKEIAELLEREIGGEIFMVPRVNNPQGVSTPDYLFHGKGYDLKTIGKGAGKNTIFNRIKKAKRQSKNFIIDVTESGLEEHTINCQIEKIFQDKETQFVDEIIIIRNGKIVKVTKRI